MIYDKLENLQNYPGLEKIKAFLEEQNGKILENGKYVIDENCYVAVSEYETGVGKDFEAHREYIDVQMLVYGDERVFVQDIQKGQPVTEYNEKKDVIFYTTEDSAVYALNESNFLLLDVNDLHKPCVAAERPMKVKKYVFKIKKGRNILKQVMQKERDAITQMIEDTDEQYDEILNLFENCKGKLVFMGVGKSGHIGEKLAATFASLGLPSFFVHSTEAMHGDLGMIGPKDIAVLISNSGNTQEVVQNVEPLRRNGVTTVAFTSGKDSKLAKACDYVLLYPKIAETDVLNLAPTVSSTLTLVLGDAIACELSARKNFKREDFYKFHPNGALGAMLKKEEN